MPLHGRPAESERTQTDVQQPQLVRVQFPLPSSSTASNSSRAVCILGASSMLVSFSRLNFLASLRKGRRRRQLQSSQFGGAQHARQRSVGFRTCSFPNTQSDHYSRSRRRAGASASPSPCRSTDYPRRPAPCPPSSPQHCLSLSGAPLSLARALASRCRARHGEPAPPQSAIAPLSLPGSRTLSSETSFNSALSAARSASGRPTHFLSTSRYGDNGTHRPPKTSQLTVIAAAEIANRLTAQFLRLRPTAKYRGW